MYCLFKIKIVQLKLFVPSRRELHVYQNISTVIIFSTKWYILLFKSLENKIEWVLDP